MRFTSGKKISPLWRALGLKVLAAFLFQLISPTMSYALTGGPSQPEVQGFTPIGTTEMVNVFSGDFNYNIPLLDVDGYPINISYSSGSGMEEEASWVGLGWSLNVGTVQRSMRGLPDDFKGGDVIQKEQNLKPTRTIGLGAGGSLEIAGIDALSINANVGINFNNYYGFGFEKSVSLSINSSSSGNGPLTASLGLTSDTNNGLTIQPNLSLEARASKTEKGQYNGIAMSIGTSYNTRSGMKQLSIGAKLTERTEVQTKKGTVVQNTGNLELASSSFDLGQPTYSPTVGMNMKNLSISGRFTGGAEIFPAHPNASINAYYSSQALDNTSSSNPAYGYLYTGHGQNNTSALHDFNREKDGPFVNTTPVLPLANYTYDIFSVSGQGVGGSYRPFRGDVGHVYDPHTYSSSDGYDVGLELGVGNTAHNGFSISVNNVNSNSGKWSSSASSFYSAKTKTAGNLFEDYYFKEANESGVSSEPEWMNSMGGDKAVRLALQDNGNFNVSVQNTLVDANGLSYTPVTNKRQKREKRSQVISTLTHKEVTVDRMGLYGPNHSQLDLYPSAQPYHISEITALSNDGSRYFYSIPVYNHHQLDVSFAVDAPGQDCSGNLISYNPGSDDSMGNSNGLDNYYSSSSTPAYAHSYLLTAIVSPDYVDSDNTWGPSDKDNGTYTLFKYQDAYNYNWRSPVGENMATHSEGVRPDHLDDKASYVYGSKDLRYLKSIETKNYVCVFYLDNDASFGGSMPARQDAYGATQNGTVDAASASRYLVKIELYTKKGLAQNEPPIKTVHFEYDWQSPLCPNIANGIGNNPGKLTLKEVYFSYEGSGKGKLSRYQFTYASNQKYNNVAIDRWGNFKYSDGSCPSNAYFPYTNQKYRNDGGERIYQINDVDQFADELIYAWHLNAIQLPSGGKIKVDYESDDYAYVQNKEAMQMFKIVGYGDNNSNEVVMSGPGTQFELYPDSYLVFELPNPEEDIDPSLLVQDLPNIIYLKCAVNLPPVPSTENDYEFIPVYAKWQQGSCEVFQHTDNLYYGKLKLQDVTINDNGGDFVSPVTKAAIQYGRLNASKIIYGDYTVPDMSDVSDLTLNLLNEMVDFIFDSNLSEMFESPNTNRFDEGCGRHMLPYYSYIRLKTPHGHKLGGGTRVKSVKIFDNWSVMSGSTAQEATYGQEYFYTLQDGRSSGVAAYEPMIGGDENPFRMPIEYSIENTLAPDEARFIETPVGESLFPSPSVGYSRVLVRDYVPVNDVTNHGTGYTVQEFYTAKDFPTIVEKTGIDIERHKSPDLSIASLLNIESKDFVTVSQGFAITLNDMHGKPKGQYVFAEGQTQPLSSVEYIYQTDVLGADGSMKLNNLVQVIYDDGTTGYAEVGVQYDMINDVRESENATTGGGVNYNTDTFSLIIIPVVVLPTFFPHISDQVVRFRSATTTKVIQRFGVLKRVVATDNTSVVETENLAYDALTGQVLVTKTINNYDDHVYSITVPAHWHYDGMGPAYKNIAFEMNGLVFDTNGMASALNADDYFVVGDEVTCMVGVNPNRAWITEVTSNSLKAQLKSGDPITGAQNLKVVRSGRRNMSQTPISQITSLVNPLETFEGNIYESVVQASAIEFSDAWSTMCDCFSKDNINFDSSNLFVLGTKGTWRPTRNYAYLTDRAQSYYNYNTNVREDGVFVAFNPFYYHDSGVWKIDKSNWTWASEITEYSPYGYELENRDALGRYSAAHYGYNKTLPIAVAANAAYSDIGFNNFEEFVLGSTGGPTVDQGCGHSLFFVGGEITNTYHTGRQSIKVTNATPAVYNFYQWDDCEDRETSGKGVLNLELNMQGVFNVLITNGSGTYTADLEVYEGTVNIANISGNTISLTGSSPYAAKLTVSDSNGAIGSILLTK
jgi:hypothetical protein